MASSKSRKLQRLLPAKYATMVTFFEERQGGFVAVLRADIKRKAEAIDWLEQFCEISSSILRVDKTFPENSQKLVFKKEFRCVYSRTSHRSKRPRIEHTACNAKLTITVKQRKLKRSKDAYLKKFPTEILVRHTHNHPLVHPKSIKLHALRRKDIRELFHEHRPQTLASEIHNRYEKHDDVVREDRVEPIYSDSEETVSHPVVTVFNLTSAVFAPLKDKNIVLNNVSKGDRSWFNRPNPQNLPTDENSESIIILPDEEMITNRQNAETTQPDPPDPPEPDPNVPDVPEPEMNASEPPKNDQNASDLPETELNASDFLKPDENTSDLPERNQNASDLSEPELEAPDFPEPDPNASDLPERDQNASDLPKPELNASDSSECDQNASDVPQNAPNASPQTRPNPTSLITSKIDAMCLSLKKHVVENPEIFCNAVEAFVERFESLGSEMSLAIALSTFGTYSGSESVVRTPEKAVKSPIKRKIIGVQPAFVVKRRLKMGRSFKRRAKNGPLVI